MEKQELLKYLLAIYAGLVVGFILWIVVTYLSRPSYSSPSPIMNVNFLGLTSGVHAEDAVNLLTLHEQLGERLGVGTFAGGLIASAILLMMAVLPIALINRSRKGGGSPVAELFVGITILGVCVAITWFPIWIFVLLCFLTALLFSDKITGVVGK